MKEARIRPLPKVGDRLPDLHIENIEPRDIMLMALILRDPNPIHYDVDAVRAAGLGEVAVNQGGSTMAYVINLLSQWSGSPANIRSLRCRFSANVLAGQGVLAGGAVTAVAAESERAIVHCDVWADRDDGVRAIAGTASVLYPVATQHV